MIEQILTYFLKRKKLKRWKEEKRKKWAQEGRSSQEIEEILKEHKIKF